MTDRQKAIQECIDLLDQSAKDYEAAKSIIWRNAFQEAARQLRDKLREEQP